MLQAKIGFATTSAGAAQYGSPISLEADLKVCVCALWCMCVCVSCGACVCLCVCVCVCPVVRGPLLSVRSKVLFLTKI